jgi:hypothetical protein
MKHISFILLLSISTFSTAQEKNKEPDQKTSSDKKFSFTGFASADYTYRTLFITKNADTGNTEAYNAIINSRNNIEKPNFTFSGGFSIVWNSGKWYNLETGITYSDRGYKTDWIEVTGFSDPLVPDSIKLNYHFRYLEIPAKFMIGLSQKTLYGGVGLSPGFLFRADADFHQLFADGHKEKSNSVEPYDFKRFSLAGSAHIGLRFRLNEKYSIRTESYFKIGALDIIDAPLSNRLWSTGLNVIFQVF